MDNQNTPKKDMSRSTQTRIFLAVAFVFGVYGYDYMLKHDRSDPNAQCNSVVGYDGSCVAGMAAARMRAGY